MYDYNQLQALMERTVHKYNQFEKIKHTYQGGVELTHAELHTIACIGDHPGLNLTTLAKMKGITKSAASQMIYRLRDKGLVTKEVAAHSDAAICIGLTEVGQRAYEEHKNHHEKANNQFFNMLEKVPEDTARELEQILLQFDQAIDEWMK